MYFFNFGRVFVNICTCSPDICCCGCRNPHIANADREPLCRKPDVVDPLQFVDKLTGTVRSIVVVKSVDDGTVGSTKCLFTERSLEKFAVNDVVFPLKVFWK